MSRYDSPPKNLTLTEDMILQRPPPPAPRKPRRRPVNTDVELIPTPTPARRTIRQVVAVVPLGNEHRNESGLNQSQEMFRINDNNSPIHAFPLSPPAPKRLFAQDEEVEQMIVISNNRFVGAREENRETEHSRRSPPAERDGYVIPMDDESYHDVPPCGTEASSSSRALFQHRKRRFPDF